jgi:hypothetical protein
MIYCHLPNHREIVSPFVLLATRTPPSSGYVEAWRPAINKAIPLLNKPPLKQALCDHLHTYRPRTDRIRPPNEGAERTTGTFSTAPTPRIATCGWLMTGARTSTDWINVSRD